MNDAVFKKNESDEGVPITPREFIKRIHWKKIYCPECGVLLNHRCGKNGGIFTRWQKHHHDNECPYIGNDNPTITRETVFTPDEIAEMLKYSQNKIPYGEKIKGSHYGAPRGKDKKKRKPRVMFRDCKTQLGPKDYWHIRNTYGEIISVEITTYCVYLNLRTNRNYSSSIALDKEFINANSLPDSLFTTLKENVNQSRSKHDKVIVRCIGFIDKDRKNLKAKKFFIKPINLQALLINDKSVSCIMS